jgi:hypothetical protein
MLHHRGGIPATLRSVEDRWHAQVAPVVRRDPRSRRRGPRADGAPST